MEHNLERFIDAQEHDFLLALKEIRAGCKKSHWIWYIFPQLKQLGRSSMAKYYGIENIKEAKEYLMHPVLGARLNEICTALLALEIDDPYKIMGSVDGMKLRSSMTLFSLSSDNNSIFDAVLNKFFNGEKDPQTIELILKTPNQD